MFHQAGTDAGQHTSSRMPPLFNGVAVPHPYAPRSGQRFRVICPSVHLFWSMFLWGTMVISWPQMLY